MREYRGFYYKEGKKNFWLGRLPNKFGRIKAYADNFVEAQEKAMSVSTDIADVIILLPCSKRKEDQEEDQEE